MDDTRIVLSGFWVATMLIYLLGDVLRIFSGDFEKMGGMKDTTQAMWFGIAVLMLTPILMVVLTLILPHNIARWANIIMAIFWFIFNIIGIPGYPSAYDKFLLAVSMVFNVGVVWYAWKWVA